MHLPSSEPPISAFYRYEVHRYHPSPDRERGYASAPVVIVGAGPIGLATALDLARYGVASIVLNQELQVSHGSRAIVLTRRSLEILQQIGVVKPFLQKGLPWSKGRSFFRGHEVYRMLMPHDPDDRFHPALNIQQQYIEEYLVRFCASNSLIDLRWGEKLVGISQSSDAVLLRIDTPEGEYELRADWLIAADGGRSTIRKLLGLKMEGRSYAGNFVIADIKAHIDLPTERLCYFDPSWSPGNNVLVHRQPDDLWRIDYKLPEGESVGEALEPSRLASRVDAVLEMIGKATRWELDWATVYSANTLTLGDYVHGRILFTGDAAHLLPIFGVRGCNTGFQDCNNLAWKLGFVIRGWSGRALLASYSNERVQAAREICEEGGKSTRFMTPPTSGSRLMRDAVLSFSLSEDYVKDLLHWRTSRAHDYRDSVLNSFPEADAEFRGGIACGQSARNVKLGEADYFFDHLDGRAGFWVVAFLSCGGQSARVDQIFAAVGRLPFPITRILVACQEKSTGGHADMVIKDFEGALARRYDAISGTVYALRPDLHVCARWRKTDAAQVCRALRIAMGA